MGVAPPDYIGRGFSHTQGIAASSRITCYCAMPHTFRPHSATPCVCVLIMAAVFGRTEISLKKTGVSATIPDSPVAKLMYYFDCVCSCVEPDSNATTRRLRAYKDYSDLSNEE